jgi:putative endonuclease
VFYVYILVSLLDSSLYTGQTNHLPERLKRHNRGNVKTTKQKAPYRLAYFEAYPTRSQAMWREWEFKTKWNTERKKKLITSFDNALISKILGL